MEIKGVVWFGVFLQNLYIDFMLSQFSFTQLSPPHTHKYQVFWTRALVHHTEDKCCQLLSPHHKSLGMFLQIRALLTSVSINVRQGSYSWSIFPFGIYVYFPFRLTGIWKWTAYVIICSLVAVQWLWALTFVTVLWSHQSAGFLAVTDNMLPSFTSGAMAFITNTYHSFNPFSAVFSSAQTHLLFHSYCVTISPNTSFTNLCISCRLLHSDLSHLSAVQNCTEIM